MFAQYVSPPAGGISIASRIAAIGGRSTYVMSACQIASPSPRPPIGTPPSLMFEITFISGWSARNGRPSGFGPGGSSSPKVLLKASTCGSESFWPRKRSTRCSSQASRISLNVCSSIGRERSTPPTSAPMTFPSFLISSEFKDHRLMIRGLRLRIDADGLQARHQIRRDEYIVAAVGLLAVEQVEGVLARLAGVERLPRVDESAAEHFLVMRVARRQVEVAAHEGALASIE